MDASAVDRLIGFYMDDIDVFKEHIAKLRQCCTHVYEDGTNAFGADLVCVVCGNQSSPVQKVEVGHDSGT